MSIVQDGVEHRRSIAEEKGSCPRCHGFMVPMILDGSEEVMVDWCELLGRRCINCGERIDPLILANRRGVEEEGTMKEKRFRSGVNGHDRGKISSKRFRDRPNKQRR